MIRPDGYVKVLDFGLAKLVQPEQPLGELENEPAKSNETAQGIILGTVQYMSPEQAKGEAVDLQTDIFSFGTVIYEMLTGKTPFQADSVSETFANLLKS
jgi:eukaryotic-like serine/threonine-protein kinase